MSIMHDDPILGLAVDRSFDSLAAADHHIADLRIEEQVIVMVVSAQGVIDNGGLHAFFSDDFPGRPSYAAFVTAYRMAGAHAAAAILECAAALFPFEHIHVDRDERVRFLASGARATDMAKLDREISGDRSVWRSLGRYARLHEQSFAR
jgi:hypothetical protein